VSDTLHQSITVSADDINPDVLLVALADVVATLEEGAEDRKIALDWGSFRYVVDQDVEQPEHGGRIAKLVATANVL
jgi:hypothetical protein